MQPVKFQATAKSVFFDEIGKTFEVVLDSISVQFRISMLCLFVSTNCIRIHDLPLVLGVLLASQKR